MQDKPVSAPPGRVGRLAIIAGVVALLALAFVFAGGWLSPDRLSPKRFVSQLSGMGGNPLGHRRNHSKGVCVTGSFAANGAGAAISSAPMLAQGTYPVIGRFAIGVQSPNAADAMGRVKSLALRITTPDGSEWRSGSNAMPFFPVKTPAAFYDLLTANNPDPATGKPDPQAMPRFVAAHPEIKAFGAWAASAPWTLSWADQSYNSIDAFRFTGGTDGQDHVVRWSWRTGLQPAVVPAADLSGAGHDFMAQDLVKRLAAGPLTWHLIVTLAQPGDVSADPTVAWPADRTTVDAGTLTLDHWQDEANGPCRDINYDPTILPAGMAVSDDPFLAARSAAYARSFTLREGETPDYPHNPDSPHNNGSAP